MYSTILGMPNLVSLPREVRRGELTGSTKSASGSGRMGVGKEVVMFSLALASESTREK
jgi:hypothetical protein